ncbi:hypothetical protein DAPPUDRAFT_310672 [Daphnia pulex]|uniref:Uncharacterized protein n=1 Tax=Daphnia pulex TaxID=6669 RepID=E9FV39_DAPPU|nr:hypothetical protein DAPPUDRAFT_310672 [Daphnia pulex]|eukprot:EFX88490.1 hypothetical protein DAPPUDRAFT_310672 [Daphnia pulex]
MPSTEKLTTAVNDLPKVLVIEECQTFKVHSCNHVPNDLTPIRNGMDFLEIRSSSPGQESFLLFNTTDSLRSTGSLFIKLLIEVMKGDNSLGLCQAMFRV